MPSHGRLRVGTFNLWSGRAFDPRSRDGDALESDALVRSVVALGDLGVDVLAVQEVDRAQPRSAGTDQLAVAAHAFGAVAHRFAPTLTGVPGRVEDWAGIPRHHAHAPHEAPSVLAGPSYGIGLISRLPVLSWRVRQLTASRAVLPVALPGEGRWPRFVLVPDEPRTALAAVVETDDGPVTVISTHLSFSPVAARRQLRAVVRWAASLPGPHVLAGDLNLPGRVPARLSGWSALASARTYPSPAPRIQLDHLLTDGAVADLPGAPGAVRLEVSDHRALVGDLRLSRG